MIEALIAYIQDRGFTVGVIPGVVLMYKIVDDRQVGMSWAILDIELKQMPKSFLFYLADERMKQIDDAIAARRVLQS